MLYTVKISKLPHVMIMCTTVKKQKCNKYISEVLNPRIQENILQTVKLSTTHCENVKGGPHFVCVRARVCVFRQSPVFLKLYLNVVSQVSFKTLTRLKCPTVQEKCIFLKQTFFFLKHSVLISHFYTWDDWEKASAGVMTRTFFSPRNRVVIDLANSEPSRNIQTVKLILIYSVIFQGFNLFIACSVIFLSLSLSFFLISSLSLPLSLFPSLSLSPLLSLFLSLSL